MTEPRTRLSAIDNLRSALIVWVIAFHTAIAYSHIGAWYWHQPGVVDDASSLAFLSFETHSQAFFMGILFLVSGMFVPGAYDRKGARRFLWDRFVRLGIPSLLYIFAVQPLMLHYLLGVGHDGLAAYYRGFLASGNWTSGSGPMWFAIALLIFCAVYAGWRQIVPQRPALRVPGLGAILATGLIIALAAFLIRTVSPMGSSVLYFQPPFFAQYVVLFVVGIAAARGDWLKRLSKGRGYFCLAAALLFTAISWPVLVVFGGGLERSIAPYIGGWNWPSAGYALWESIFCVLFSAGLLVLFREKFNTSGPLSRLMSANAFGMYFLHPPVVIAVTMIAAPLTLPPLAKWAVVAPCAVIATLGVAMVARQVPLLKKIL